LKEFFPAIGDEFNSIDWKTTSRTGRLHVRLKLIDKRATIIFLIDKSRSGEFGSFNYTKEDIQKELLSLLVYAASEAGNEIGFITFTDKIENFIRPTAGEKESLKNMKIILSETPSSNFTDLNVALSFLNRTIKSPALIFILSDFLAPHNYEHTLAALSNKHEVVPIIIADKTEINVPNARGFVTMQDMECLTTKTIPVLAMRNITMPYIDLFKKLVIDSIIILSDENRSMWIKKISEFFDKRIRRGGRIRK